MKKNWKKVLVGTLCLVGFLLLLVKGNQFEKVSLISTEGQSYEKAVVTKITKDNLAEDGNRYGTQEVRVQVKSAEPCLFPICCFPADCGTKKEPSYNGSYICLLSSLNFSGSKAGSTNI